MPVQCNMNILNGGIWLGENYKYACVGVGVCVSVCMSVHVCLCVCVSVCVCDND